MKDANQKKTFTFSEFNDKVKVFKESVSWKQSILHCKATTQFLEDWLVYCVLIKLPWIVKEDDPTRRLELAQSLKEEYLRLRLSDSAFGRTVVVCVQLISRFVTEHFSFIQTNYFLEAQFCVILHHVLLGLCVGIQTYNLIRKQHSPNLQTVRFEGRRSIVGVPPTRGTPLTPPPDEVPPTQLRLRRHDGRNKQPSIRDRPSFKDDPFLEFQQVLKENLYVKPLPKIVRKKLRIEDFELGIVTPVTRSQLKEFIEVGQLSSASLIHNLLRKEETVAVPTHKIHCTLRTKPMLLPPLLEGTDTLPQLRTEEPKHNSKHKEAPNWNQIVEELKRNSLSTISNSKLPINEQNNTIKRNSVTHN